jgi:excisionase family DNA binding protein
MYLTVNDLAKRLNLAPKTIRKLARDRVIPVLRIKDYWRSPAMVCTTLRIESEDL